MPTSNKIEKIIQLQKQKNTHELMMKQQSLKLKNDLLFPHHRNSRSSFRSSTASSCAKKKQFLSPTTKKLLSKYETDRRKSMATAKPHGFESHYDKLKKRRTKSTIVTLNQTYSNKNYQKRIKTNKQRAKFVKASHHSKKKYTIPKAFSFATTARISKHKLIQQKTTENTQPNNCTNDNIVKQSTNRKTSLLKNHKHQSRIKKSSTKKRSLSFALPTKTSNSKRNSKYIANRETNKNLSISVIQKQKNSNGIQPQSKTAKRRKSRGISKIYKNKFKQLGISSALSSTKNSKTLKHKQRCFSFDETSFKKMKKKLRRGIVINNNKCRQMSNIQSAYAQNSTNKRNKAFLTPINEENKNNNHTIIEDLAIDEFLTEDVYTIQGSITPVIIKNINDTSPRKLSIKSPINNRMSPVQIITKKNSFIDELLFKDLLELDNKQCNKEERLHNLFNQIAAKMDIHTTQ